MGTQANIFTDVVFEAVPNRAALNTQMNALKWTPWADDQFVTTRVVAKWDGNNCYMRVLTTDWNDLLSNFPSTMSVLSSKDSFGQLTYADPENRTEAELNANNVWYEISQDDQKVAEIRKERPKEIDDGEGGKIQQGLKFGAFDNRNTDFRGKNED